jgi:hypothetical protein
MGNAFALQKPDDQNRALLNFMMYIVMSGIGFAALLGQMITVFLFLGELSRGPNLLSVPGLAVIAVFALIIITIYVFRTALAHGLSWNEHYLLYYTMIHIQQEARKVEDNGNPHSALFAVIKKWDSARLKKNGRMDVKYYPCEVLDTVKMLCGHKYVDCKEVQVVDPVPFEQIKERIDEALRLERDKVSKTLMTLASVNKALQPPPASLTQQLIRVLKLVVKSSTIDQG